MLIGCATTTPTTLSENNLVSFAHNPETGYTLTVYENEQGEVRHVVRRDGICEFIMVYTPSGVIKIEEQGKERVIDVITAGNWTKMINALLKSPEPAIMLSEEHQQRIVPVP